MKIIIICLSFIFPLLSLGQTANELVKIHEFADLNSLNTVINPAAASFAYTLDNNHMHYFNGTSWIQIPASGTVGDNWKLSGNSVVASDFLGTTNNQALTFRQNNVEKWRMEVNGTLTPLNTGNSIFIGLNCGTNDDFTDNNNIAIGYQSLSNNSSGHHNVALGRENLTSNTTGFTNVAIGDRNLQDNTLGSFNIAMGFQCLSSNIVGNYNVAIGLQALNSNAFGTNNIAIGHRSLESGSASHNIALGHLSIANSAGWHNIAIGREASKSNTTGFDNVAVGTYNLNFNVTGSRNTAIGHAASLNTGSPNNSTTLGAATNHAGSNTVRIGNNVLSIGGPQNWSGTSDARFKRNVRENVVGLDFILGLRPVTYNFDYKAINQHQKGMVDTMLTEGDYQKLQEVVNIGFLAQEVEALADSLEFDFHGVDKPRFDEDVYGLRYSEFVPSLVKAIQELKEIIEHQNQEIELLKKSKNKK